MAADVATAKIMAQDGAGYDYQEVLTSIFLHTFHKYQALDFNAQRLQYCGYNSVVSLRIGYTVSIMCNDSK